LESGPVRRLSIIVPLMGNLKRLEDTLVSVLENQPDQSEVIVVLNQPYDDPYQLRGEVEFVEAPLSADLVECFAFGLVASRAPWVHVIAAGVEATPGWADSAVARFAEADVAAVAPVVVDRDEPNRVLSAGLRYTAAGSIGRISAGKRLDRFTVDDRILCGPELTSAFYRRDVLEAVGALHNFGSELASSAELALFLRKTGYRAVQEPACVTLATGELFRPANTWREGVACEWLFHRSKAIPGWRRSWAAHAALVAMECLQLPLRPSLLGRLAGRFVATLGFGPRRDVAIGTPCISSQQDSVIRGPHFGPPDVRPALQSRVAG
jgi:hypothetical protein